LIFYQTIVQWYINLFIDHVYLTGCSQNFLSVGIHNAVFCQAPACLHPATPQPPNHARSPRDGRSSRRRAHRSSAPTPPLRCPRLCPSHTPASPAPCRHADLAHARRLPDPVAPCPRRARGSPSRPALALPADLALARMDADLAHAHRLPAPAMPLPRPRTGRLRRRHRRLRGHSHLPPLLFGCLTPWDGAYGMCSSPPPLRDFSQCFVNPKPTPIRRKSIER
jgi:hypothetical protein